MTSILRNANAATIAAVTTLFVLTGCGGGGGGRAIPPTGGTPVTSSSPGAVTPPQTAASATFTIVVPQPAPNAASAARRPAYVSVNTASVRISVLNVDGQTASVPDTVARIASGAAGCTGQPLRCTVTASAPIGQIVAFRMSTYASSDASGSVLSTATFTAPIAANGTNAIPVTLGGVVDHIAISPSRLSAPSDGAYHSYLLTVTAFDASKAVIVGADPFASPVTLSIGNDPNGALSLTQTSISTPGQTVELKYNGVKQLVDGKIYSGTTASGTLQSDFVALNYTPGKASVQITEAPQSITASEMGFTGQFTATVTDSTLASVSIGTTANGTATLVVSPPSPGSYDGNTTIALSDGTVTGLIPVHVGYPILATTLWNVGGTPQQMSLSGVWQGSPTAVADTTFQYIDTSNDSIHAFFPQYGNGSPVAPLDGTSLPAVPTSLTEGPDGYSWFTQNDFTVSQMCQPPQDNNQYKVTCFTAPTQTQAYNRLTTGPDGKIWFTQSSPPAIGTFDPVTHKFVTYARGISPNANPSWITTGPDGNMWFTDSTGAVGKVTVSTHVITVYPSGQGSQPEGMAAGPDGSVWFVDANGLAPAIGKINVQTGAVTDFTAGLQRKPVLQSIVAGPDGRMWFTDASSAVGGEDLVGAIDPATGFIQEYAMSAPAAQAQYLVALGSKLEFTDPYLSAFGFSGGSVGEITLPSSQAPAARARAASALNIRARPIR